MAREKTKRQYTWRARINTEINTVQFQLHDNWKDQAVPAYDFRVYFDKMDPIIKSLPEPVRYVIGVGVEDSVRDAGALGAKATHKQKMAAMRERAEYIEQGCPNGWERKGVRGPSDTSLLYRVLEEAFPKADARETLLAMHSDAMKQGVAWSKYMAVILATPQLAPIAQKIREEGAKQEKSLAGSDLLKGLGLTLPSAETEDSEDGEEEDAA